jgi:hypothetical protein
MSTRKEGEQSTPNVEQNPESTSAKEQGELKPEINTVWDLIEYIHAEQKKGELRKHVDKELISDKEYEKVIDRIKEIYFPLINNMDDPKTRLSIQNLLNNSESNGSPIRKITRSGNIRGYFKKLLEDLLVKFPQQEE